MLKKSIISSLMMVTLIMILYLTPGRSASERDDLMKLDAREALALANQWRWDGKKVASFVNSKAVVFKFPDGEVVQVPLPPDEMVVAVAPYIKKTHK